MAKVSQAHIAIIRDKSAEYLARFSYTLESVETGADAWTVLHKSGAYRAIGDEYPSGYPDYSDGHLQTALEGIFPNVVFRDKKRY